MKTKMKVIGQDESGITIHLQFLPEVTDDTSGGKSIVKIRPVVTVGTKVIETEVAGRRGPKPSRLHRVILLNGVPYVHRGQPSKEVLNKRKFVMLPINTEYNPKVHGEGKPFVSLKTPLAVAA